MVHIRCGCHDCLASRDDNAIGATFNHMQITVRVRLLMRAQTAIPLGISHGYTDSEVSILRLMQILEKPRVIFRSLSLIN